MAPTSTGLGTVGPFNPGELGDKGTATSREAMTTFLVQAATVPRRVWMMDGAQRRTGWAPSARSIRAEWRIKGPVDFTRWQVRHSVQGSDDSRQSGSWTAPAPSRRRRGLVQSGTELEG